MAGNIVKWWKHKILGGYKQFSVQECNTDSEELVQQQVRAASSCSAPPDLLLVSEREHSLNQRATAAASTSEANLNGNHHTHTHNHHNQNNLSYNHHHQQQLLTTKSTKEPTVTKHSKNDYNASTKCKTSKLVDIDTAVEDNVDNAIASVACKEQQAIMPERQNDCVGYEKERERGGDDRLRFEEFTCDVSVEGGKSSKPLQFSFTFYDLDGHHGKITKDDIVGIVYTIYESIGKSVVVPHYGSKTINVRLTFSPESKNKSSAAAAPNNNAGDCVDGKVAAATNTNGGIKSHGRRQHRYRPRKLIKSEDEDDDSQSDKEKENNNVAATRSSSHKSKHSKHLGKLKILEQFQQKYQPNKDDNNHSQSHSARTNTNTYTNTQTNTLTQSINTDSIYDNINLENLKCCAAGQSKDTTTTGAAVILEGGCSGCGIKLNHDSATTAHSHRHIEGGDFPTNKQITLASSSSTRVKVLRRVRNKQKQQDHQHCAEHRQRSLSVGNEICYKNRHLQHEQQLQQQITKQTQNVDKLDEPPTPTMLDGVQLRHPQKDTLSGGTRCQKRNSAECWKSALNRNDLISIIRESMEKNRLCFQLNEKPQANVTPIRQMQHHRSSLQQTPHHHQQHNNSQQNHQPQQRMRANTVSKIPTLIAHHSNSYVNNNSNLTTVNNNNVNTNNTRTNNNNNIEAQIGYDQHQNHSSHTSLCQLQPHIPIYHQQMAINPAVVAAQNNLIGHRKMNPCGYDSFLHATICTGGGGGSVSTTPLPPTTPTLAHDQVQQPIAAVQPILSSAPSPQESKISHTAGSGGATHQIKLSKVLRSGAYSQNYHNYHSSSILSANSPAAPQNTTQNSPQYRGYQRLATQHNLPASLHLQASSTGANDVLRTHNEKRTHSRDRCPKSKQSLKYNESLVYAKLREDLQENIFNTGNNILGGGGGEHVITNKPKSQLAHRKHATHKMSRHSGQQLQQPAQEQQQQPAFASGKVDYISILGMNGQVDALECENLLDEQTSDEDFNSEEVPTPNVDTDITLAILESEDTLPTPSTITHTNNSMTNNVTTFTTPNNTEPLIDLNDDDTECKLDAELTAADVEADGDLEDIEDDVDAEVDLGDEAEPNEEDEDDDIEDVADNLIANNNNNAGHSHLSPSSSRAALATSATITNNTANANNTAANTSTASASSLIHRCVHEHIHHHYHHFEKKDE